MFIGGCAGSTACGIKIFRLQMLLIFLKNQIKRLISPNSVIITKYNNQKISDHFINSVIILFLRFFLFFNNSYVIVYKWFRFYHIHIWGS